jgi:hypothetical protein
VGVFFNKDIYCEMKELIRHILREHTKEIGEQRIPQWNLENLKKEALKYNTEKDFIKFSNSAYQTARRLGVLDQILSHVQRNVRRKSLVEFENSASSEFS